MITDRLVYRNGWDMIKSYGPTAGAEAKKFADGLAQQGDKEGSFLWSRVVEAIDDIWGTAPRPTSH